MTKTRRFRIRLAGFMNMIEFSLETKWPRLTQKPNENEPLARF